LLEKEVKAMSNEERLSRLCTYDLLMRIRRGLQAGPCLIDILSSDTGVNKRCTPDTSCPECIAKWLGEEAHNDT
jgi:hypothetical protein